MYCKHYYTAHYTTHTTLYRTPRFLDEAVWLLFFLDKLADRLMQVLKLR